ncbi:P-loop containing nucleoside triphosphate hydrolase protein [Xylona heveae TC161]|uniref:p-loop containing nucleoside triphosphate hydrolase protein n=1 Tax=Xylona heveae (strain CBS 132557 / TC161) TaxID=1328760 RepID=A0A161TQV6_XYLHT|nr:P-loop containing nucleoside triphosphate hydrolase protein [Xylona heveae TC161]KZF24766.1 P-loop containing nucleoside triphosphate hydrolase protein [Xylona heveae TC161]
MTRPLEDAAHAANNLASTEAVAPEPLLSVKIEQPPAETDLSKNFNQSENEAPSSASVSSKDGETVPEKVSQAAANPDKKWYKRINPLKRSSKPAVPQERIVSREHGAGFFSRLTFQWMSPIMAVGYQRPLELNDIWLVNPDRSVDVMVAKLDASLRERVARGDKQPLFWAMHDTFKVEFWIGGLCQLTGSIFQVISPFTMRYLISFATDAYIAQRRGTPGPNIGHGIGLVIGITLMQIFQSLGMSHSMYRGMMVGGQSRAVLISLIFEKAMKISARARAGGQALETATPKEDDDNNATNSKASKKFFGGKKRSKQSKVDPKLAKGVAGDGAGWANGRVVNLMSTDTQRIDQACAMCHMIWTSPVAIIITLVLLLINLTYSALAGFGFLVLAVPIIGRGVKSLFTRRKAINKITDQRVSLTQEILSAVRFVKLFGWESSFLGRIRQIRNKEINAIQKLLAMRNAINAVSMSLPIFASMLAFITYRLSSHDLNAAHVFSSLALFNALRMPLNFLPLIIGQCVDALASIGRIQEFLLAEEAKEEVESIEQAKEAVVLKGAGFTWERTSTQDSQSGKPAGPPANKKQAKKERNLNKNEEKQAQETPKPDNSATNLSEAEPFKLEGLNLEVGRNELIAIIGGVGSGKTSLLAALAGEMRKTNGQIMIGASRAYCPQYAWIQNATLKDNILFGKDFDEAWYEKVLDACSLRQDLEILPNGDLTEIGERGITLSGGQKQRLNIARAIYFNADIVIMDDPLSAVDAHVGRNIFDNAICGLLEGKCRILATHQLHVLNRCDRIVWMDQGRIESIGTFHELMANNPRFAEVMKTTAVEEKKEEAGETSDEEVEEEKKDVKKSTGPKPAGALMQQEEKSTKSVSWGVYVAYLRASGTILNGPIVFALLVSTQVANIATSLWLSWWTSNKFGYSTGTYIGIYAALGVAQAFMMFLYAFGLSTLGTHASKVMLHRAMFRVLRAPMSFFDTTPMGRITNRFAKDVDTMDNNLTDALRMYGLTLGMIIAVFVLIIVYFHYFAIALGPLFILFLFAAGYYRASAREVKRFEAVLRSVVFSRFSEGLTGTACIRAYGLTDRFIRSLRDSIDNMNSAYFLTFSNQRWLSLRLDTIGNLLVFTTGILVVTSRFNVSPSISGLVLSYILSIVQIMQFTVRQLAEVENAMNSTERLYHYGVALEQEAPLQLGEIRQSWPEQGEILFDNVQMRYRDGLPLVLHGFSLHVQGGERIGIVGRTGAGKSSIMSTLFRLVELSGGSITIDGLDIAKVGLQDLRSRLAIIPQDPTLFRGTIRSNLDPFSEHTDLELWSALRQSGLISADNSPDDKTTKALDLETLVEDEGLNFSLGQRQLMALARALVRNAQIIICDEATSSVDVAMDEKIQQTMATAFSGRTLLCIAHRLRTIINYDRICVMDQGRIAELATPLELFDQSGIFRSMCDRSGIPREEIAKRLAKE